jgi:hypothetical protein
MTQTSKSTYRKETVRLRMVDIQPSLVSKLNAALPGSLLKTNERRAKDKSKLVVLLELNDSTDCRKLRRFISGHKILPHKCSLLIGVVTEQYMDGIRVPGFCRLTFYATCVGELIFLYQDITALKGGGHSEGKGCCHSFGFVELFFVSPPGLALLIAASNVKNSLNRRPGLSPQRPRLLRGAAVPLWLCLPTCPTYDATKLERNSPRRSR